MTEVYPIEIRQGMSMDDTYILILAAPKRQLWIPIIIGEHEAQSIIMVQNNIKARRPMTHELMSNVMNEFGIAIDHVSIDHFEEGIFQSTLHLTDGLTEKQVDSRTSDAVTLALLQDCKIYCTNKVIDETGIAPESLMADSLEETTDQQTIEELEQQLKECEENEDYERAAELMERIHKMKGNTK